MWIFSKIIITKFQSNKTRQINGKGVIMTTYMQEEIDVDAIPRKTDVPVCTTMTRFCLCLCLCLCQRKDSCAPIFHFQHAEALTD